MGKDAIQIGDPRYQRLSQDELRSIAQSHKGDYCHLAGWAVRIGKYMELADPSCELSPMIFRPDRFTREALMRLSRDHSFLVKSLDDILDFVEGCYSTWEASPTEGNEMDVFRNMTSLQERIAAAVKILQEEASWPAPEVDAKSTQSPGKFRRWRRAEIELAAKAVAVEAEADGTLLDLTITEIRRRIEKTHGRKPSQGAVQKTHAWKQIRARKEGLARKRMIAAADMGSEDGFDAVSEAGAVEQSVLYHSGAPSGSTQEAEQEVADALLDIETKAGRNLSDEQRIEFLGTLLIAHGEGPETFDAKVAEIKRRVRRKQSPM